MDNQIINSQNQPQSSNYSKIINNSDFFLNKKVLFLISILLFILLIITSSLLFLNKKSNKKNKIDISTSKKKSFFEDLSKYNKDTDNDGYPDFIEIATGLNKDLSEAIRCQENSCNSNLQTDSHKKNVLIILDSSGSMDLLIGGQKRMDLAKQAIKNYIKQASTTTNVGLMIYGHKGSNNTSDKAVSCATAEIIGNIGEVNSQNIDNILTPIKPTGWTLIGKAINESVNAFSGKEGQKNEIIIVTDGEETCNSDPVSAAKNIKSSILDVTVNVIGFAIDNQAALSLIQIANAGGGSFVTASNGEELDQKFKELYQKGLQAYEYTKCKGSELETINKCYQEAYDKVDRYIQSEKKKYFTKSISITEYEYLSELSNKLFKQLMNFKNETLKKFQKSTNEVKNKAFEQ